MLRAVTVAAALILLSAPSVRADWRRGGPDKVLAISSGLILGQDFSFALLPDSSIIATFAAGVPGEPENADDVYVQHFSADGSSLGPATRVNTFQEGYQRRSSVAVDETGGYLVIYDSFVDSFSSAGAGVGRDGVGNGVFARAFLADGTPRTATEFQVNSDGSKDELPNGVAYLGSGRYGVAWTRYIDNGVPSNYSLHQYQTHVDALGNVLLADQRVASAPVDREGGATIASAADGDYVLAWTTRSLPRTVRARKFSPDGTPVFEIEVASSSDPIDPWVSGAVMADNGNFVVLYNTDPAGSEQLAVAFDSAGLPISTAIPGDFSFLAGAPDGRWATGEQLQTLHATAVQRASDGTTIGAARTIRDGAYPTAGGSTAVEMNAFGSLTVLQLEYGETPTFPDGYWWSPYPGPRIVLRRLCDSSDPDCQQCATDSDMDADVDGLDDACDPCVALPSSAFDSVQEYIAYAPSDGALAPRDKRFRLKGTFTIEGVATLSGLPVVQRGMRIRIEAESGPALIDTTLPGGAFAGMGTRGWTAKPSSTRYRDDTGSLLAGFYRVKLKALPSGAIRVQVDAASGEYGVGDGLAPLKVILGFGNQADAQDGLCVEGAHAVDECDVRTGYVPHSPYFAGHIACASAQ